MKITHVPIYILLIIGVSSCSPSQPKPERISTTLPEVENKVKTIRLGYADFNQELMANGIISAVRKADLKFETSEVIEAIYVRNGDKVVQGQKIASLDQFKLQSSVRQAKDNWERARLELQDVLIGRGYSLTDSAGIPPQVMKIAKIRSNYDNALINYEMAQHNLKKSVIYAPFDGIVANLSAKEYNVPSSDPFCTVISNNDLEIQFSILESELSIVRTGDKIVVTPFSIPNTNVHGVISEINPMIDKNGMVRVKASVQSPKERLYDGMSANVCIHRSISRQLIVPKGAIVLRGNRKVVFTLEGRKAIWHYVQTGLENADSYTITEGLTEGDTVIYNGNINLAHEASVNQTEED